MASTAPTRLPRAAQHASRSSRSARCPVGVGIDQQLGLTEDVCRFQFRVSTAKAVRTMVRTNQPLRGMANSPWLGLALTEPLSEETTDVGSSSIETANTAFAEKEVKFLPSEMRRRSDPSLAFKVCRFALLIDNAAILQEDELVLEFGVAFFMRSERAGSVRLIGCVMKKNALSSRSE